MHHVEVRIVRNGDPPPFPEMKGRVCHEIELEKFVILQEGTEKGKATVSYIATLPNGEGVLIKTTAKMLNAMWHATKGACESWGENIAE